MERITALQKLAQTMYDWYKGQSHDDKSAFAFTCKAIEAVCEPAEALEVINSITRGNARYLRLLGVRSLKEAKT